MVGEHRHLMFATQTQLELLKTCKRWFMDGTFKVVSKKAVFPVVVHTWFFKKRGQYEAGTAMFCPDDKEVVRRLVLRHIKERYQPAVECGMLDFEPGCWSAIRKVFPGMKLKGCVFHWKQCVWRKVQGVGLAGTYYERKTIYNYAPTTC
ncbi:uncharacterized protein LOC130012399 [Patella vulgata]|uniref:uncharacterized protein LOC130012399 n=1 Tax=Patella vulgata TaxID=6465 RepID=UPI0024A89153|nr:uncharacterized protein LOC130012399 [Patella vulgata]